MIVLSQAHLIVEQGAGTTSDTSCLRPSMPRGISDTSTLTIKGSGTAHGVGSLSRGTRCDVEDTLSTITHQVLHLNRRASNHSYAAWSRGCIVIKSYVS